MGRFFSFLLILLAGCGGTKGYVSETLKSQLGQTFGRINRTVAGIQTANEITQGTSELGTATTQTLRTFELATTTGGKRDQDAEEITAWMERAITSGDCKTINNLSFGARPPGFAADPLRATQAGTAEFSINGEKCPAHFKLASTTTSEGAATFTLEYTSNLPEFAQLTGIKTAQMDGTILTKKNVDPMQDFTSELDLESALKMEGLLQTAEGDLLNVQITSTSQAKGFPAKGQISGTASTSMTLSFEEQSVELKTSTTIEDREMKVEYTLNGTSISKDDFIHFMGPGPLSPN